MSSGFGLDDFYALAEFAVGVYKQCRDCTGPYRSLASDTRQLSSILEDLSDLAKSGKIDASKKAELLDRGEGCRDVLLALDTQLKKYNSLSTQSKRTWDRMGWDQQGGQDLKDDISGSTAALNKFYDTLLSSSQVMIQEALDQLMTDYQGGFRDSSGVSTLVAADEDEDGDGGDEDVAWPQIIKDLKDLGISEELAAEHRTLIVDWFLKAINESLLQEKPPEDKDMDRAIWTIHEPDSLDLVGQKDGNKITSPEGLGSPQVSTPGADTGTPDRAFPDTEPDVVADKLRALDVEFESPTNDCGVREASPPKTEPPRIYVAHVESELPEVVVGPGFEAPPPKPPKAPPQPPFGDAGLEVAYPGLAEPEFGTPGLETPPPLPPKAKFDDAGLELAPGPAAPVSGLEVVDWDMSSGLELAPGPPVAAAGLEPAPGPEVATCDPEPFPPLPPYEDHSFGFEVADGPELVTSDVDPTNVVETNMVWTAQLIVEHWNRREWHEAEKHISHQITAVQEGQFIEIRGVRRTPDIRLLTHLLGVSASFRGEFHKAKRLFESVMRTPFTSGDYLDEGDIIAAHWLGDTCVCLNQPENAALAYGIAMLGLYLRQPNNPARTARVTGELRQYNRIQSGLSNLQRTFQHRNVDASTILSTTHNANKLRLVNWCCQQQMQGPYSPATEANRRRPFISMDIVEGFLIQPLIDHRSWPLPYDPFFVPKHAAEASVMLSKKDIILESRVPTTALGNSKKLAFATRRNFSWLVDTLRRALSVHAIEYVERESGFICRLDQYHNGFSFRDCVQIRLRKLPLRNLWGFKLATMMLNTRNPRAPNFYDSEALGIEAELSELLRNFCEDAERGAI